MPYGHYKTSGTASPIEVPGYAREQFGDNVVVHIDASTYISREGVTLRNLPMVDGVFEGVEGPAWYNNYPAVDRRSTYRKQSFNGKPSLETENGMQLFFTCAPAFDSDWTMAFTVFAPDHPLTTSNRDIASFIYNDVESQAYIRLSDTETRLNMSKTGVSGATATVAPIGSTATVIASVTGTQVRLTTQSLDGDLTIDSDTITSTGGPYHMSSQGPLRDFFVLGTHLSTGPDSVDYRFGEAMLLKQGLTAPEETALLQYFESKWGA